jgi:hypothetical protein
MSQFPGNSKRRKPPVRGSYIDSDYSPWMHLNERDAASIASNTATATPIFAVASAVESLAYMTDPGSMLSSGGVATFSMSFVVTWLLQTVCFAVLKTVACLLRNRGESLFRDVTAWLWKWVIAQAWQSFTDTFFGWLPFRRRERLIPIRPVPPDGDDAKPRKRIIDRIIPRRRTK